MSRHPVDEFAAAVADRLADPCTIPERWAGRTGWRQSLAYGAPGIALLHIERAAAGFASWQRAHDWLAYATSAGVTSGDDSHLFYGAPALAHTLACAAGVRPGSYGRALEHLDQAIATDARRRIDAAHARIDAGRLPALAEFDLIRGLTGVGSYLLRRDPGQTTVRAVLEYLVRLTDPIRIGGDTLPGWWTASGPNGRADSKFADGHANSGVAHGIGGPLALLGLAARRGITVAGHIEAIGRICAWLDRRRTDTAAGPQWPYWVTRSQLRAEAETDGVPGPQRPSWCYGTAGLARAQQLAALATGDSQRRDMAESALIHALADPAQRALTCDASLCHGYAGLAHIAARVAADATPKAAGQLQALIPWLLEAIQPPTAHPGRTAAALVDQTAYGPAFLEGAVGIALAAMAARTRAMPRSGWDTCLLIT